MKIKTYFFRTNNLNNNNKIFKILSINLNNKFQLVEVVNNKFQLIVVVSYKIHKIPRVNFKSNSMNMYRLPKIKFKLILSSETCLILLIIHSEQLVSLLIKELKRRKVITF